MTAEEIDKIEENTFKYGLLQFRKFDVNLLNNLKENKITFSSPRKFNDPFDCNLPIRTECSKYDLQNLLLDISAAQNEYDLPFIRNRIEELFLNPSDLYGYIKSQIYDHRRFSCFTIGSEEKHLSNTKFWANYADKHQGVCMKFSGTLLKYYYENHKDIIGLVPIEYCTNDQMPKFNYIKNRRRREKFASQYFFGTKSEEWKDEEEVRLIYFSKQKISTEESYVNFEFNPAYLQEIFLGCYFDKSKIEEIKRIVSDQKYNHVKLFILELDKQKFRLNAVPI